MQKFTADYTKLRQTQPNYTNLHQTAQQTAPAYI